MTHPTHTKISWHTKNGITVGGRVLCTYDKYVVAIRLHNDDFPPYEGPPEILVAGENSAIYETAPDAYPGPFVIPGYPRPAQAVEVETTPSMPKYVSIIDLCNKGLSDKDFIEQLSTADGLVFPAPWGFYNLAHDSRTRTTRPNFHSDGWLPFADAPQDGSLLDIWIDGERRADVWFVREGQKMTCGVTAQKDGWWQRFVDHGADGPLEAIYGDNFAPTHFRFAPQAPVGPKMQLKNNK